MMLASAIVALIAGGVAAVDAVSIAPATTPVVTLAFLEPASFSGANGAGTTRYTAGERVNITWTTPFEHTTLILWEGPFADGSYMPSVLADKWSKDRTHLSWKASPLTDDSRHTFHFELQKGNRPNDCAACVANSPRFAIAQHSSKSSSTSSHSSTTSSHSHSKTTSSHSRTSTSTPSSTSFSSTSSTTTSTITPTSTSTPSTSSSATPTSSTSSATVGIADANVATTASSTPSYIPDSTNSEHGLAVGLAVGFGTGVPLLIALYAILLFCYTRAQRRNPSVRLPSPEDDAEHLREKEEPPPRSSTPSWISKWSDASILSQATSYHEPFEFQHSDGSKRPGSERLFRNGEPVPGSPGRFFQR